MHIGESVMHQPLVWISTARTCAIVPQQHSITREACAWDASEPPSTLPRKRRSFFAGSSVAPSSGSGAALQAGDSRVVR
jgi:hypothetical protein